MAINKAFQEFYHGKRVFVTGHTGFKGSWLCRCLVNAGASITGYSLQAPTDPNLFAAANVETHIHSIIGDVKDFRKLKLAFDAAQPEIVFHLAAQPIVRDSYKIPRETYETNVMGTVNILECVRLAKKPPRSFLNITTDKVYLNRECHEGYTEEDNLDGYDPYSNSKSCSELVTHCYQNSFFSSGPVAISTARAGNVIGGGDFANDRIIPDCVRAASEGRSIFVRNPNSIRPYQHVLEPLFAYMMIAQRQFENKDYAGYYNVGPDECDCVTSGTLVDHFCRAWEAGQAWHTGPEEGPHEALYLKLDCNKLKKMFGWTPIWHIDTAVDKTVEWTKVWLDKGDVPSCMDAQINEYYEEMSHKTVRE